MRQTLETERPASTTIPLRAAQVYVSYLVAAGGGFNDNVAQRLQGQIAVAELSGRTDVDLSSAVLESLGKLAYEAMVEDSIDNMIDHVIDLR